MSSGEILILIITLVFGAVITALLVLILRKKSGAAGDSDAFIEAVQGMLDEMRAYIDRGNTAGQSNINNSVKWSHETLTLSVGELAKTERENAAALRENILAQLMEMRGALEKSVNGMREENSLQLEKMRKTVDEKLTETLNERLSKTYTIIGERLDAVLKGFGEMQKLASGVSDLKSVLSSVKTRGMWGEIMLGNLLEQMLAPEQFRTQVSINGSRELVDYAVVLPGKDQNTMLLPIDSKFPDVSYQRMIEAGDRPAEYAEAVKALAADLKREAKSIASKYINPPETTDFAIMYLPTEGLFAEAVKLSGVAEELQLKHRIMLAGPTTLAALLNSLQMGFKTLAIEKRSMEIRQLLVTFKTEFIKFSKLLEDTQARINTLSKGIDDAAQRSRIISKKLSAVESITDTSPEEIAEAKDSE